MLISDLKSYPADYLEDLAMDNRPLPKDACDADLFLYLSFRALHAEYRFGAVSRDMAHHIKIKLLTRWKELNALEKMLVERVAQIKRIEASANAYCKDRTLENADWFHAAVYGLPYHEKGGMANGKEKSQPTPEASV